MTKRLGVFLCIAIALFGGSSLYRRLVKVPQLEEFIHPYPPRPEWTMTKQPSFDVQELRGEWTYLGSGAYSYAFAREGFPYVLKIFHYKHLKDETRSSHLERLFEAYLNAYRGMAEKSGLLYLQFNPDSSSPLWVSIRDRLGFTHQLPLHKMRFAVQRRAYSAQEKLVEAIQAKNLLLAIDLLHKVADTLIEEFDLGFVDFDRGILHNIGFASDGSVIHYDLGKVERLQEGLDCRTVWQPTLMRIYQWIERNGGADAPFIASAFESYWRASTDLISRKQLSTKIENLTHLTQ